MNSELHPLEPFLPANARVLMLGSFPPKRIRWSMDFFYPNLQNDMWRIVGYLATGDKSHFLMPGGRKFDKERIEAFCRCRGIALYDTAVEVIRLKDNASDNFLQVVREVDLAALLARLPAEDSVFEWLADREEAPLAQLPNTGVGAGLERLLSPVFIAGRDYGTRASSFLVVDAQGRVRFTEQSWYAGRPDRRRPFQFRLEPRSCPSPA